MKRISVIILMITLVFSCKPGDKQHTTINTSGKKKPKVENLVNTVFSDASVFTLGDSIRISCKAVKKANIQSASIIMGGDTLSADFANESLSFMPVVKTVGNHRFTVNYTLQDTLFERDALNFVYISDIEPENVKFKLLNTYPHDAKAYTQGLFYHMGFLYESTGHQGQSSVRKVEIGSGKILQMTALEAKYFGEGLTLIDNKVFQITYTSQTGFVYDLETLKPLRKTEYSIMEGWGLTHDGDRLMMSDGSAKIYFVEDEFFTETGRLEVYDNKGPVANLNELEFVNGKIYANVYGEKYIVAIDPETGKVLQRIDCSKIFPKNIPDNIDHVLNGIAYNPETDIFYLTGKYWPVLYEVQLLD